VGTALLVEFYNELPDPQVVGTKAWEARLRAALEVFKKRVSERYSEGTLQRLLQNHDTRARRAAFLALGLQGTMQSNPAVAATLHDEDGRVRQLAVDALWSLWFRADTAAHNQELQRIVRLRESRKKLAALSALAQKAASFAEVFNQRAILYFQMGEYQKSIADCERVLKLNPYHFGAQAGMAQSYMRLDRPRPALKAFRNALRINPGMEGVEETIRALENALGEEGKK
jgi:tetratricopeptide (TPR) repeat protein